MAITSPLGLYKACDQGLTFERAWQMVEMPSGALPISKESVRI